MEKSNIPVTVPQIPGQPNEPGLPERPEMPEGPQAPVNPELPGSPEVPGEETRSELPDHLQRFEDLLDEILERAMKKNNEIVVRRMCDEILEELDRRMLLWQQESAAMDQTGWEGKRKRTAVNLAGQEGKRESAAASSGRRESLRKKISRWLERLEN